MDIRAFQHNTGVSLRTAESAKVLARHLADRLSHAHAGREMLPVHAPFTGEHIASIPACTEADVRQTQTRARRAQACWAQVPIIRRKEIFLRYQDLVLKRRDELLDLIQLESGKARQHACEEVLDVSIVARHYAYRAKKYLCPRHRQGALPLLTSTVEYRHPVGVVGLIATWNYPLTLAISDAVPALLAGNAVILKPSEQTSLTALYAVDLLCEAGLPKDLFQIVTGPGPELGPLLIAVADFIGFTGSTKVGRIVAREAGERLIHASMELGGKNPMLVFNDANLGRAVEGAIRACFTNAGQLCIAIERLYIQAGIYERFLEALVRRTRAIRLGTSFDYDLEMGPLISQAQLDRVEEHVSDAISKGATVLTGGHPRPDLGSFFYEPTFLTGVTSEMKVYAEETFGPVVSIYRFKDEEEAIRLANHSEYGLNSSIWTKDIRKGQEIARRIECGTVNINEAYAAAWASIDAPMGGMKVSGLGRRHGRQGLLKYTEAQTVAVQRWLPLAPWPNMDAERYTRLMIWALHLLQRIPGIR